MKSKLWIPILLLAIPLLAAGQDNGKVSAQAIYSSRDRQEFRELLERLKRAGKDRDAKLYASCFASESSWEGPLGESAIGPANIERSMALVYQAVGSFETTESRLSNIRDAPRLALLDLHESAQKLPTKTDVAVAVGSTQIPGNVRTTMILRKTQQHWQVMLARVAYLRDGGEKLATQVEPHAEKMR
jgi:hypothetical protein